LDGLFMFGIDSKFPVPGAAHADFQVRYDDLTQHSHIKQVTLPMVLGKVCMENLWAQHPLVVTRKPCFAGETLLCMLRAFELDGGFGAVGYLAPEGTPSERAHCSFQLQFSSYAG
jgi:hypothetical protein